MRLLWQSTFPLIGLGLRFLIWQSGNSLGHINQIKLRQAESVLGLVIIAGGSTISVFIKVTQSHSAWPSILVYMQRVLMMISTTAALTNGEFCIAVGPVTRTAGL